MRPLGRSALPPGAKNLITARGRERVQVARDELAARRAQLAGQVSDDVRREQMLLDEKLRPLEQALRTAVVVPPPVPAERDRVRFGAAVTVRDRQGTETRYRIVGLDEADPTGGEVSYLSPIAQALLNAHLGQRVPFRFPQGRAELEIVAIAYEE